MRYLSALLCLLLFLSFLAPTLAKADIDQRCLNYCIGTGRVTAACIPDCSYNLPLNSAAVMRSRSGFSAPRSAVAQTLSGSTGLGRVENKEFSHKVFSALMPDTGGFSLRPYGLNSLKTTIMGKDYHCLNACLAAGWRYQMCNQICLKSSCGIGVTACKDLTGTAANSIFADYFSQ